MNVSADFPALKIIGSPGEMAGFIYGLKYPSLLILLQGNGEKNHSWLADVNRAFASRPEIAEGEADLPLLLPDVSLTEKIALSILHWMGRLYSAAGVPVYENGRKVMEEPDESLVMIAVTTLSFLHKESLNIFSWLLEIFNLAAAEKDYQLFLDELAKIKKRLSPAACMLKNTERFLKESLRRRIPAVSLAGDIYQYGYGSRSRLLESTFTDSTTSIGVHFARSKTSASCFLRMAGIPVPEQRIVRNIRDAEIAAEEIGFPVVVKPADLDGGIGVAAGLDSIEEVRTAFTAAFRESSNIVLEKHFEGHDFRLVVFQDELIFAVERVPGGVTGDGRSTVRQLVDQINSDPNRGDGERTLLKMLDLDEEALLLLGKKRMDAESVPPAGEFVKLRRTANIATGGSPLIASDRIHPDNAVLAVRAARLFRLDLAGIDLLITDISRSWFEIGCVICEVNAQPGLGGITSSHLYGQILSALVDGNGRIPVCVVVGAPSDWNLALEVAALLDAAGFVAGIADRNGVKAGKNVIHGPAGPFAAGAMLLMDRTVDAVILCINDTSLLQTGLPFVRFDLLVLAGSEINMPP
ncbi:MAG: hypothetical protein HGA81_06145, partial [Chlorobium limicola]|nr:hypothetical protein [Chlorobium limicola]